MLDDIPKINADELFEIIEKATKPLEDQYWKTHSEDVKNCIKDNDLSFLDFKNYLDNKIKNESQFDIALAQRLYYDFESKYFEKPLNSKKRFELQSLIINLPLIYSVLLGVIQEHQSSEQPHLITQSKIISTLYLKIENIIGDDKPDNFILAKKQLPEYGDLNIWLSFIDTIPDIVTGNLSNFINTHSKLVVSIQQDKFNCR